MQPLMGKTITAAYIEHQNWKNYFQEYLMNYRITPHPAAKILPSQLVNNRDIKLLYHKFKQTLTLTIRL